MFLIYWYILLFLLFLFYFLSDNVCTRLYRIVRFSQIIFCHLCAMKCSSNLCITLRRKCLPHLPAASLVDKSLQWHSQVLSVSPLINFLHKKRIVTQLYLFTPAPVHHDTDSETCCNFSALSQPTFQKYKRKKRKAPNYCHSFVLYDKFDVDIALALFLYLVVVKAILIYSI